MHLTQVAYFRLLPSLAFLLIATGVALSSPSSPLARAAGTCNVSRSAGSLDSEEQSMLGLINSYRARGGVGPLAASTGLDRSAMWKSADMASNRYFGHDDLTRGWLQRLSDCGYTASTADGENIAEGYGGANQTFEQWRTSPPHNANMLDANFRAIGIGRAESANGSWYWTTDFGPSAESNGASSAGPAPSVPPAAPAVPPAAPAASLTVPAAAVASSDSAQPWLLPPIPTPPDLRGTIAVGVTVLSDTPGDCLRAHTSPSLDAATAVCLPNGSSLFLVDGPQTADDHTWWFAFGAGWVASDYLHPSP